MKTNNISQAVPWPACIGLCALLAQAPMSTAAPLDSGLYRVSQTFHVGGEGGWDYFTVDFEHQLLYVPRSANDIDRFYSEALRTLALPAVQLSHRGLAARQPQRSCERVRAAFRAAVRRLAGPRRRAAERACLESARWDAARWPSRLRALRRA